MSKALRVWILLNTKTIQDRMLDRLAVVIFFAGKLIRILLFLVFLHFLFMGTKNLAGYSKEQVIFFYLTFNLVDTLGQMFFREVYIFRQVVVSGDFDFVLTKPINPLIKVLLGGGDIIDFIMFVPLLGFTLWFGVRYITSDPTAYLPYLLLLSFGFFISMALHIFILGLGIITVSVDHVVWIYRDLSSMARIPVDLYREPIKAVITFIVPLGIMMTFPPKALMGLLDPALFVVSGVVSLCLLILSLRFWNYSLEKYQSAGG